MRLKRSGNILFVGSRLKRLGILLSVVYDGKFLIL